MYSVSVKARIQSRSRENVVGTLGSQLWLKPDILVFPPYMMLNRDSAPSRCVACKSSILSVLPPKTSPPPAWLLGYEASQKEKEGTPTCTGLIEDTFNIDGLMTGVINREAISVDTSATPRSWRNGRTEFGQSDGRSLLRGYVSAG